ncbi:MAG: VTC domain-containing protein [Lentisphaerae bacterium]|nr:VTC domain-containing protein [Lentisphaerota bacterium]
MCQFVEYNSAGLSNERKFFGEAKHGDFIDAMLQSLLCYDAKYPCNIVHSIYFDTPAETSYREKSNGDGLKKKYRIRWYETQHDMSAPKSKVFLEVKHRIGSARKKTRTELDVSPDWLQNVSMTDPSLTDVLQLKGYPPRLIPAVCISYKRHRYVCPYTKGRVSLDRNIQATRFSPVLYPFGLPVKLNSLVCEFKDTGRNVIPWAVHLQNIGLKLGSFSKYGHIVAQLHEGGKPV